jgi:LDH2 family malate/lactate/ureidoglycolate dehydrogenase
LRIILDDDHDSEAGRALMDAFARDAVTPDLIAAIARWFTSITFAGPDLKTTVSSPPNMASYSAKAPGVHNSPISIGIPAGRHAPIVLDMATSVAAGGKIYYAADRGLPIPEGWALDKDGGSTTDPNKAKIWASVRGTKRIGTRDDVRMLVELARQQSVVRASHERKQAASEDQRQNVMIAATNVAAFGPPGEYIGHVDELIEGVKGLPRSGTDEILVPGERENRIFEERTRSGIVLPIGTTDRIRVVAQRLKVQTPWSA